MRYLKSLLTLLAIVLASGVASAAVPSGYTLNPADGKVADNAAGIVNINLSVPSSFTIKAGAFATLSNLETGLEVESTQVKDFSAMMGSPLLIINFDEAEITENGEWELVIPAGTITVNGEGNPEITATYTLNDPNLGIGEYPQIELISSDPASGSNVRAIGESALNKVSFVTSDDDAVNYIGWAIYDITNSKTIPEGDENGQPGFAEYVYSGSENRIDYNRNYDYSDAWTDGLFITIGGPEQYLIDGHKYEMLLTFAGIGYNPDTNQYPSPDQIKKSTELTTSIYFNGVTKATEYSPYTVVSVDPDPEVYEIDNANEARFVITYSGPVKPTSFEYAIGSGAGTSSAGTFTAIGKGEGKEYSEMWEFWLDPSLVAGATGSLLTSVKASDADGLPVKGNGGYAQDDFIYTMNWECNVGAPDLVSISPAVNAEVESLSSITVGNNQNMVMGLGYQGYARILDLQGAEIRVLDYPVASSDEMQMTWNFEEITTPGSYILQIDKYYFSLGTEASGSSSKLTSFRYIVVGTETPSEAEYDLEPVKVTPADGAVVQGLEDVVLTFADITNIDLEVAPVATLYKVDGDNLTKYATVESNQGDDWFSPKAYTFSFAAPIIEDGVYQLVIPKGSFFDDDYAASNGAEGHATPELIYEFTVDMTYYDVVPTEVVPADKAEVAELSTITLMFGTPVFSATDEAPVATLYKVEEDKETLVEEVKGVGNDDYFPTDYTFTLAKAITDEATYKLVVAKGVFTYTNENGNNDDTEGVLQGVHANPELVYTFVVKESEGIEAIVAGEGVVTVYTISGVKVLEAAPAAELQNLGNGLYIVNGAKVYKK